MTRFATIRTEYAQSLIDSFAIFKPAELDELIQALAAVRATAAVAAGGSF